MTVAYYDRRNGSERRSGRERRLTFDSKYIYVPDRRSDLDRRVGAERRLLERRSGTDRRKIRIERRLLFDLNRLEYILERRRGIDRRGGKGSSTHPP
jgi:hypothetical protein